MPASDYSANYLLYNQIATKNIVVAVKIAGLDTVLASGPLFKRVRYGDPGINYGTPGIVYGGLIPYGNFQSLLDLNGASLTISQRLEPEQGRGAVSTLSLSFIDLNQYMTQLVSPGILIPDILGAQVTVYLGYQEISYPEDFLVIFRGRVSSYDAQAGRVTLQLSDPNMVRRQQVMYIPQTTLSAPISAVDTTIPVVSNTDFFRQILGPNGAYDPAISTYLTINNEIIQYPATGVGTNVFTGCVRGARSTTASSAPAGTTVSCSIQIQDHAIDMALKLMLSGWDGPYLTGLGIQNFRYSDYVGVPSQAGLIELPPGVDADRDYGISTGDYLTITGAAVSGNNQTVQVLELVDMGGGTAPNQGIITNGSFAVETGASAVFSVRSQYDTYPVACGVKLPATEVDVKQHQAIKAEFLSSDENRMRFYFTSAESSLKTFLESQIYLPLACYSLTRFGRLSMQLTHAPIAGQVLEFLNGTNVLNPQNIKPQRGINNRKFFNEIDWEYNFYDDNQTSATVVKTLDTNSLNVIGVTMVLPIKSLGSRTDLGSDAVISRRTNFLLSRYKNGAVLLNIDVNWGTGSLIEAGDVVAIQDDGVLQISNFVTGARDLGVSLWEVIDRSLDIKNGAAKLQLVSGLGAQVTDRYGVISPSSVIQPGSDPNNLVITDSYGALYPLQEWRKWSDYFNQGVRLLVHSEDYSVAATATLVNQQASAPNTLTVLGLSLAASALPGLIIDVDNYSLSTDIHDQMIIKTIHDSFSKQVLVSASASTTSFYVATSATQYFQAGFPVIVHDDTWATISNETTILTVDVGTGLITTKGALGFAPSAGMEIDLLGFADGGAAYRYI